MAKIAFFPEAAFGPALNSVGIAQAVQALGHKAIFLSDPGFVSVYEGYGFEAHPVNLSEPMPPEQMAKFWEDFINSHIPNFRKSPYDQVDNYVKDCWTAIVDSAKWAEKDLPAVLAKIQPDLICVDNVILFPAIKHFGKPWIRIISCSENEIEDEMIPPHLSGCRQDDLAGHKAYRDHFNAVIKPIHDDYNAFLASTGEAAYPIGQFFEASPYMNLLLYPDAVKFNRKHPLDPKQFQYLEGCVRKEVPYEVPSFVSNNDKPLIYISFGSLGAGDTDLLKRLIATIGKLPYRALVNVGDYKGEYENVPGNVVIESWFPQPSVIPQVDAVIHHGGNNSFTECLYFGKPAIIMPYVWDGHDNATRVDETGHGFKFPRYDWTEEELAEKLAFMINDPTMQAKLKASSKHMQAQNGPQKAAMVLDELVRMGNMMAETLKSTAPHIHNATTFSDLVDWGDQPDMQEGQSHSSGRLLFKGPNNQPETGIWVCTPGRWRLTTPRDEFCHFVSGRATYRHDNGEVIEVDAGTAVTFLAGWTGECTVHETMRNIYMLV